MHSGIELDVVARPMDKLRITGFVSVGNWEYKGSVITREFDQDRNLLTEAEEDVDGGKVGDAAQFTAGLGFNYEILERFSVDADWRTYDKLYATVGAVKENLELPTFDVVDLGVSYRMLLGALDKSSLDLRLNVNNLFDEVYLSELRSNIEANPGDTTWNGVNVNNQGYFGLGRTWNFGIRFNF